MEKMNMQSADGVQANIEKIASLFPDCVTETITGYELDGSPILKHKVDFEKLQQNLSSEIISGKEERYQFTWPDKKKAILLANSPINATLRPRREESVDFDNTKNLYIEGDNLDVLKCLKETYLHKVKMIYIDPPYNTGNDFVYNDDFAESASEYLANSGQFDEQGHRLVTNTESNGRFHTDWLNMIYPRLKVARDLLTDDGVIFISIDDHEQDNLKRICCELFGERNFIGQISWRRTDNQPNIGCFARVKEYILLYAKSPNYHLGRLSLTEKARAEYRYSDAKGLFRRSILLHKTRGRKFYPKVTKLGNTLNGPWLVSKEEFDRMDANDEIYWTENGDGQPYGKIYLSESKGQIPNDFWNIDFGTNQRGSIEVEKLFNHRYFDFPKPVSLLYNLLKIGSNSNSIVLDFFSGSSTTAHAVMQLNAEDRGNRKFIMVQLPEFTGEKSEAYKAGYNTICEIGKERIRRAGKKIKEENPLTTQNLDTGFRVLKLDSSNMQDVYYSLADTTQPIIFNLVDNVKEDRTPEDLLFQVMLELGATLDSKIETIAIAEKQIFNVADNYLVACFDMDIDDDVVTAIAKMEPQYAVLRDKSLSNDSTATNFEQIFKMYAPNTVIKIL